METRRSGDGDPDFGPDEYVYRRYHLLRTKAVLNGRAALMLPKRDSGTDRSSLQRCGAGGR